MGCPVEAPVRPLHEAGLRICPVAPREKVERRQRPRRRDPEDRTKRIRAVLIRRPVEVPVGSLHEAGVRRSPVAPREGVERRQRPAGVILKTVP